MRPETAAALESASALLHAAGDATDKVDRIRARRPSKSARVIPEVDATGRLTDLYIAPGTVAAFSSRQELVDEILGAIADSTLDAARQRRAAMAETPRPGSTES